MSARTEPAPEELKPEAPSPSIFDQLTTIFFAVPRVWQKFHDAMLDQIAAKPRPVRSVIERFMIS